MQILGDFIQTVGVGGVAAIWAVKAMAGVAVLRFWRGRRPAK